MPSMRPIFNDFSAGEISPRLSGRVDLPVYYQGAQELTNFQVRTLGGINKRPGTKFISHTRAVTGVDQKARLIPFVYDEDNVFILELTAGIIRIIDAGTGSIVLSGGSAATIPTSYLEDELFDVHYAQTTREIYFVHRKYKPLRVKFLSAGSGAVTVEYENVDSFAGNLITWTAPDVWDASELWDKVAKWLSVNKSYTASGTFESKTVSSLTRSDSSLTITYSDATTRVIARSSTDLTYAGSISLDLRPFIGAGNYPGVIAFFSARLWLGSTINEPSELWASKPFCFKDFVLFEDVFYDTEEKTDSGRVGDDFTGATVKNNAVITGVSPALSVNAHIGKYVSGINIAYGSKILSNGSDTITLDKPAIAAGLGSLAISTWKDATIPEYEETEESTQQVGAANAIRLKLATEENEDIVWIAGSDNLYVGTATSEWVISGSSNATQASAAILSRYGSSNTQARFVGSSLLYVSCSSRQIRQIAEGLSQPITVQAEHVVKPGIVQLEFQQSPDVCLYAVLANGELVRCLIEQSLSVMAWDRVRMRSGDTVESVAVVPYPRYGSTIDSGASRDLVFITVKRGTSRYIELFQENDDAVSETQWYLDCASFVSNNTTIGGLDRFEGETITVRYQIGAAVPIVAQLEVSNGEISIGAVAAAWILAGIPYLARLRTHRIEASETEGLTKSIGNIFLRLYNSFGFIIKHTESSVSGEVGYIPIVPETVPFTGPLSVTTDIPVKTDSEIVIDSDDPVPCGIQSIIPNAEIGG